MMETDICAFCYKIKDNVENEPNIYVGRFTNLLERFTSGGQNLDPSDHNDHHLNNWGCCKQCRVTVDAFCEDYHKLKCLEMKMEWKLHCLLGIMEFAGRVPSRWFNLQQSFKSDSLCNLKSYRSKIIKRCNSRLSNSQPRVILERSLERQQVPVKIKSEAEPNNGIEDFEGDNNTEAGANSPDGNPQIETFHTENANPALNIKLEVESPKIMETFSDDDDQLDEPSQDPLPNSGLFLGNDVIVEKSESRNNLVTQPIQGIKSGQGIISHRSNAHSRTKRKLPKHQKWQCKICGRNLVNKSRLEEHIKCIHMKGPPDVPCKTCGKMFLTRHRMLVHTNTVHVEPTHQCTVCQKMCKTKTDLRYHGFTHQDPETWRFKCDLCDRRFYMKQHLRVHMQSHNRNRILPD